MGDEAFTQSYLFQLLCQSSYCQPFKVRRVSHPGANRYRAEFCSKLTAINLTPIWEERSDLSRNYDLADEFIGHLILLSHPQWCSILGCCWSLEIQLPSSFPGITRHWGSRLSAPPQETQAPWVVWRLSCWAHRTPWRIHLEKMSGEFVVVYYYLN